MPSGLSHPSGYGRRLDPGTTTASRRGPSAGTPFRVAGAPFPTAPEAPLPSPTREPVSGRAAAAVGEPRAERPEGAETRAQPVAREPAGARGPRAEPTDAADPAEPAERARGRPDVDGIGPKGDEAENAGGSCSRDETALPADASTAAPVLPLAVTPSAVAGAEPLPAASDLDAASGEESGGARATPATAASSSPVPPGPTRTGHVAALSGSTPPGPEAVTSDDTAPTRPAVEAGGTALERGSPRPALKRDARPAQGSTATAGPDLAPDGGTDAVSAQETATAAPGSLATKSASEALPVPALAQARQPDAASAPSGPGQNPGPVPAPGPETPAPDGSGAIAATGGASATTSRSPGAAGAARLDAAERPGRAGLGRPEAGGPVEPGPNGAAAPAKAEAPSAEPLPPSLAPATTPASPVQSADGGPLPGSPGPVPIVHDVRLAAVPVEIGLKSLAGVNRFEMRLDPPELGRVDVRVEINEDGGVRARLLVDRADTLALLQRDAPQLRHALEQAGLKPDEGSVDVMLRDPSGQSFAEGRDGRGGSERGQPEPSRAGPVKAPEQNPFVRPAPTPSRGRDGIDRTV